MNELQKITPVQQETARQQVVTPMDMLNQAIEKGANIDLLERLMGLHERWEQGQARKAYTEAKAAFKAEVPAIVKDKDNLQYKSKYASIGNLVNTVNLTLSKHGLDAAWDIDQSDKITVTCILTHTMGHSERVKMTAAADTSGAKNPIQQIKSTITYLRVATYEAVTGIATTEGSQDDDGNSAAGSALISDEQVDELVALADDAGADKAKLCQFFEIGSFADIPASQFSKVKAAIEAKRKKAAQ
jgi:ERF superfamily